LRHKVHKSGISQQFPPCGRKPYEIKQLCLEPGDAGLIGPRALLTLARANVNGNRPSPALTLARANVNGPRDPFSGLGAWSVGPVGPVGPSRACGPTVCGKHRRGLTWPGFPGHVSPARAPVSYLYTLGLWALAGPMQGPSLRTVGLGR